MFNKGGIWGEPFCQVVCVFLCRLVDVFISQITSYLQCGMNSANSENAKLILFYEQNILNG